jgi:hypothetical protein
MGPPRIQKRGHTPELRELAATCHLGTLHGDLSCGSSEGRLELGLATVPLRVGHARVSKGVRRVHRPSAPSADPDDAPHQGDEDRGVQRHDGQDNEQMCHAATLDFAERMLYGNAQREDIALNMHDR